MTTEVSKKITKNVCDKEKKRREGGGRGDVRGIVAVLSDAISPLEQMCQKMERTAGEMKGLNLCV